MVMLSLFGYLALAGASYATLFHENSRSLATQANVEPPIDIFVKSLNLHREKASLLLDSLVKDENLGAFLSNRSYDKPKLTSAACKTLEVVLGPESVDTLPVNQSIIQDSWSQTAWLSPTCVILPDTREDVSIAIKAVRFFSSRFSVRSGGHSPNPGHSTLNTPGILIDLHRLNQISISNDRKIATLGPGARWGDVYAALDPYDVSVLGARIPHVGVGGTLLGGGFFHFSGQFGMAADNIQNFEVVVADGSIIDANAKRNTDLFWALKGGGPNYGIITKFDVHTFPVKNIWYQVGIYSNDQVPAILDAFTEWQITGSTDTKSTVALIIGLQSTTLGLFYSEPANQPAVFKPFYGIPTLTIALPATNGTVLSLTQVLGSTFSNVPQRHDYRAASSKVDAQLYKDVYKFWQEQASAVHASTGANMSFTLQPIPANLAQEGINKGGNPMGIPKETHQWWTTLIDWANAEDDDVVRGVAIATERKWKELGEEKGLHIPYRFLNDASRDQNPLASYGAENLRKLKQVAAMYDPSQVFQNLQNGGFLVSKA
jgi:FAD/FMN-containing dehydrogenase